MGIENFNINQERLFEKKTKEQITTYLFKNLGIALDRSGKNYQELPELLFGAVDVDTQTGSLDQPKQQNPDVNMTYFAECFKKVIEDSGERKFWLYPYSNDTNGDQDFRREARLRLFQRFGNLELDENEHGYILDMDNQNK